MLPPDLNGALSGDTFEDRRDAIDVIATMRARTIRIALFGTLIHRPDPENASYAGNHEARVQILRDQVLIMRMVAELITGKGNFDRFPPSLCTWIVEQSELSPASVKTITTMVDLSAKVLDVIENDPDNMASALAVHLKFGRSGFAEIVTDFCNTLWASLDEKRAQDTDKANQATKTVGEILTRLEYIGKHVRLVSLNASVEAARAGDAGRGLAVIATEFKTLAEEIQSLATRGRGQIDTI